MINARVSTQLLAFIGKHRVHCARPKPPRSSRCVCAVPNLPIRASDRKISHVCGPINSSLDFRFLMHRVPNIICHWLYFVYFTEQMQFNMTKKKSGMELKLFFSTNFHWFFRTIENFIFFDFIELFQSLVYFYFVGPKTCWEKCQNFENVMNPWNVYIRKMCYKNYYLEGEEFFVIFPQMA